MPPHYTSLEGAPPRRHSIVTHELAGWVRLLDDDGSILAGIRGRSGAAGFCKDGAPMGADEIEMEPGSAFPLHVHPGDHILYVLSGEGYVQIDGADIAISAGDSLYLPAELPHGVRAGTTGNLRFIAIGHPHRPLQSADRMKRISPR